MLGRTMRGAGWVVAWRMTTRVLGLGSTLVLVRLLAPDSFGLVALGAAFVAALDVLLSIGVEDQLVRAHDPDRAMYDTAFTLNLIRALVVGVGIAAIAIPAGEYFGDVRLGPVLLAIAASSAFSGLTNIGVVDFRRHLQFDKEFHLQMLPRLAGIAATIGGAILLRNHWALVMGIVTNRAGNVIMSYVLSPYRPRLNLSAWRALAGVSVLSWAISATSALRDRMDSLVIGRNLSPLQVGVFAVGTEVATLPTSELVDPICRACMPGFATALRGGGMDTVTETYLRIVGLIAMVTLPAGFGISLISGPVVALAFGQNWLDAVPVVAVVGAAWTLTSFGNVSGAMLNARCMLRTLLGVTMASTVLRLPLLLLLLPLYGLLGAAVAIAIVMAMENMALVVLTLRLLQLRASRLLAAVARPILATAVMVLVTWLSGLGWTGAPETASRAAWLMAGGIAAGAVSYTLALVGLWLLAGRPVGPESDVLSVLRGLARRLPPLRRLGAVSGG
jgi:O-antigen/teichoic acid export membrane protein